MSVYHFQGKHLIAEYYNLDFDHKAVLDKVKKHLEDAMLLAEVTCVDIICEAFDPMGYTIVAALLESHISVHAYPEHRAMFIDVFTCGDKDPRIIHEFLVKQLEIEKFNVKVIPRGKTQ